MSSSVPPEAGLSAVQTSVEPTQLLQEKLWKSLLSVTVIQYVPGRSETSGWLGSARTAEPVTEEPSFNVMVMHVWLVVQKLPVSVLPTSADDVPTMHAAIAPTTAKTESKPNQGE
jgi:hypothetical protein